MFWAADVQLSQKLLLISLELLVLYVVAAMMPMTLKELRVACGFAAAGGVIAATYGLHLYRSGIAEYKDRLWLHTDSSSWNPDHFAGSLLMPIALCLVAVFWARSAIVRIVAGLGMAIMLLTLVYTGARGAALGFLALLVYLMIRDSHRWKLAIGGGVVALVAVIAEGHKYLARWQDATQSGGSGRLSIWTVGWHAFQQNWLYGAGYGNFPFAYDRAFINVFESFYGQWHRASHNIILGYGVDLGIIGVALLVCAWWGQFRMLRFVREDDPRWPFKLALEASLVALFVSGMFADIMTEKYVWLAFMLVAFTYNAGPRRVAEPSPVQVRAVANA
jgi:hypothetical protein